MKYKASIDICQSKPPGTEKPKSTRPRRMVHDEILQLHHLNIRADILLDIRNLRPNTCQESHGPKVIDFFGFPEIPEGLY